MSNEWDFDLYQTRAQEWRARAEVLPPGKERDGCQVLADGYARLAEHLSKMGSAEAPAK
jgi:hypothetical protein